MILPLILALNAHPDLGRQLAAARDSLAKCSHAHVEGRVLTPLRHRGGVIPKSVSRKHADAKSVSYPEKVAGGSLTGGGYMAAAPPSGFTLPQGSQQEVMFNDTRNRQSVRPELHAATGGGASVQHAGYFSRHPGVACLTKAAAAFGIGYLIASFGEDHDTRTVFVVPQHDGDGDDDNDHHEGHGHRKDCKR